MIIISKTLLAGAVGLTFAGAVALLSDARSGPAVVPDPAQDRMALQASNADAMSDDSVWDVRYQNRPGCPSSACSIGAVFHMAR